MSRDPYLPLPQPDPEPTPLSRQSNRRLNRDMLALIQHLHAGMTALGVPPEELWERSAVTLAAALVSVPGAMSQVNLPRLAEVGAKMTRHAYR